VKNDDRPGRPRTALPMTTLKKCETWFQRPKFGFSGSSWGCQFGQGKCST